MENGVGRIKGPRCIALIGPFASGKTTLLEAILARTGAINRQGTIAEKNTRRAPKRSAIQPEAGISIAIVSE